MKHESFVLPGRLFPNHHRQAVWDDEGVWVTQRFSWISGVDRGRQRLRGTTTGAPSIRRYRSGERCCRRGGSTWRSTLPPVGGPSRWPARLRKGAQETAGTRGEATVPASSQGRSYVPRVRGRAQRFKTQEIRFRWRSKVKTYKTYLWGSVSRAIWK